MNREDLRAQIQAAAVRLTDELVGYFGEMLQSVVKDVTVGVADAKPLQKATVPTKKATKRVAKPAPKKAAKPVAKPAPKKAAKPVAKPAPKKAAAPKPTPKKAETPKPAIKKAAAAKPTKPAAPKAAAKPAPKKAAAPKAAAKPAPASKAAIKSGRRSIKELDQAADKVAAFLKDKGTQMRIEEINKALGTSTRELMRPIKKLLSLGKIQKRGDRRSTTYFAT
jgi:outer membrane biosynthesis protein TonB